VCGQLLSPPIVIIRCLDGNGSSLDLIGATNKGEGAAMGIQHHLLPFPLIRYHKHLANFTMPLKFGAFTVSAEHLRSQLHYKNKINLVFRLL